MIFREIKKVPSIDGTFFGLWRGLDAGEAGVDFAEYVTDDWSEDHEGCDNYDGDQNEDKSIFNETLAFFFRCK